MTSDVQRNEGMRPPASSAVIRQRMENQRRRDTAPEVAVRRELHKRGLRYRVDYPLPGLRRRGDIVFPRARVACFVDGCFWHGCSVHRTYPKSNANWWQRKLDANIARDRDTDARLSQAGWTVIRCWEHDDATAVANQIEKAVKLRTAGSGNRDGSGRTARDARRQREGPGVPSRWPTSSVT
jgi:DNA mismatch endonuclease (patch repair protein)